MRNLVDMVLFLEGLITAGRPQRGGIWSNADRGGEKDLADVHNLVLFMLFQHALQTLSTSDAYI